MDASLPLVIQSFIETRDSTQLRRDGASGGQVLEQNNQLVVTLRADDLNPSQIHRRFEALVASLGLFDPCGDGIVGSGSGSGSGSKSFPGRREVPVERRGRNRVELDRSSPDWPRLACHPPGSAQARPITDNRIGSERSGAERIDRIGRIAQSKNPPHLTGEPRATRPAELMTPLQSHHSNPVTPLQ